jgi:hypothetical protein
MFVGAKQQVTDFVRHRAAKQRAPIHAGAGSEVMHAINKDPAPTALNPPTMLRVSRSHL